MTESKIPINFHSERTNYQRVSRGLWKEIENFELKLFLKVWPPLCCGGQGGHGGQEVIDQIMAKAILAIWPAWVSAENFRFFLQIYVYKHHWVPLYCWRKKPELLRNALKQAEDRRLIIWCESSGCSQNATKCLRALCWYLSLSLKIRRWSSSQRRDMFNGIACCAMMNIDSTDKCSKRHVSNATMVANSVWMNSPCRS